MHCVEYIHAIYCLNNKQCGIIPQNIYTHIWYWQKGACMKKVLVLSSLLLAGCLEEKDYCAEYVDYMCSCHEDDPNYDCAAQQAI